MKRVVTLLAAGCALFVGCSGVIDDPALAAGGAALALSVQARPAQDPPASPDVPGVPPGIYKQIARRAEAFFGEPTLGGSRTIFADQLAARLAAGEKIFIIDVRDAAAYAAGHIPGAVNMPLKTLFEPETLAQIPADGTPVVTTCVTGHTASMAMSGLGTLGYDAYVLRFGMMGWNASTSMKVGSSAGAPQLILGFGGPLASEAAVSSWDGGSLNANTLGVPPGIYKQIARRAEAFFGEPTLGGSRTIFADQLAARLAAGEKIFIIDVRDAAAYAAGHIPGAVNMPLKTLFEPETLAQIPADGTPVVTTCVTGHTASMAMSGLGTLGYDAYVLRFGMMGWNASTSMKVGSSAGAPQLILGFGGPLATGSEP